jgi:hypothetical protein
MKLLLLTPCEKVINDPVSGHSLIAIFHGVNLALPVDSEVVPRDAVIPRAWAIFSKWELEPHEERKEYASVVQIYWPNGDDFAKHTIVASQPAQNGMAFIVNIQGFPIGQTGKLRVVNWLERDGETISEKNEFSMRVNVTYDLENEHQ